jgi:hypothetical protein
MATIGADVRFQQFVENAAFFCSVHFVRDAVIAERKHIYIFPSSPVGVCRSASELIIWKLLAFEFWTSIFQIRITRHQHAGRAASDGRRLSLDRTTAPTEKIRDFSMAYITQRDCARKRTAELYFILGISIRYPVRSDCATIVANRDRASTAPALVHEPIAPAGHNAPNGNLGLFLIVATPVLFLYCAFVF